MAVLQAVNGQSPELQLLSQRLLFREIPAVVEWQQQYSAIKSRYQFLVLDGPSGTGKTRYAHSLAPHPAWRTSYLADCSGGDLDLRRFNIDEHRMQILQGMDPVAAISVKKVVQAGKDPCVLGASPIKLAGYTVCTFNVMIVIVSNRWQDTLQLLDQVDRDWVTKNSVVIDMKQTLDHVVVLRNGKL